jgi:LmbE family N-acetylglucosaminyl deacetylase
VGRSLLALTLVLGACAPRVRPLAPSSSLHLVVVAPHPDDETIAAGGLIERTASLGGTVDVIMVTDGDGYVEAAAALAGVETPAAADYLTLGRLRREEAQRAVARLDPHATIHFLGYPDGGLEWLWEEHREVPYTSPYTGRGGFTGDALIRDLRTLLDRLAPTLVVSADARDVHLDHSATGRFVDDVLPTLGARPTLLTYVVHDPAWPPALEDGADMPPPDPARYPGTRWMSLHLTRTEVATKRAALDEYRTQLPVLGGLLVRFLRASEVYAETQTNE